VAVADALWPSAPDNEDRSPGRTRRYAESPCNLASRCALTCQSHCVLEAFAEQRLARQQRHSLHADTAVRAFHSKYFNEYRGVKGAPRQHLANRFQTVRVHAQTTNLTAGLRHGYRNRISAAKLIRERRRRRMEAAGLAFHYRRRSLRLSGAR
jgi:hypothetical protein